MEKRREYTMWFVLSGPHGQRATHWGGGQWGKSKDIPVLGEASFISREEEGEEIVLF